ncbi:YveK family protein [Cohnella sp. AR92]|uniref:YveK family protein n=1 Tax=Cohnella sp. AR92 TaxID=648716 RepID=UPI000F8ED597|nr:Wzz/FepE/Etk N-terminal domain-containing protein [Cohnella sp. AR92]RUS45281.1 lipopolysaccharide biosynthesis protein [Cohnella sp. AR92]
MELKESLSIIRKKIWMIAAIVLTATVLSGIYTLFYVAPTYEASTKLLVNHQDRYSDGTPMLDWNAVNTNIMLMNSYKEIIQSEAILNAVAAAHPEFGLTGKELMYYITASSSTDSQIMTVSVRDGSYERAVSIANSVAEEFRKQIPTIMKVDNVAILTAANPNDEPTQVAPNPPLTVILAFLLSSMFAIGLVFLLDYLDDTFKSESDVEKYLELPTLSLIHAIRKDDLTPKTSASATPPNQQLSNESHPIGEKSYATFNS